MPNRTIHSGGREAEGLAPFLRISMLHIMQMMLHIVRITYIISRGLRPTPPPRFLLASRWSGTNFGGSENLAKNNFLKQFHEIWPTNLTENMKKTAKTLPESS